MPIEKYVKRCEISGFLGPFNYLLPIVGFAFKNFYKFNVGQFSLGYLNYDLCEMFLGITHKVKLE
jgi:hypothetical protein